MNSIEHVNFIKAPVSEVYRALVSETGLSAIWTPKLKVKPEEGHINEFDFDESEITRMKVIQLTENERIEWKCVTSDPEWVDTSIIFELSEKDGLTQVILKHTDWNAITPFYRWCNYNWALFLLRLKKYCENLIK